MKKNIIHNKIPIDDNGHSIIKLDMIEDIHNAIKNKLGEEYIVITTPTELNMIDGDAMIITIDYKGYSYNELMEIIEKANMYDGLCV